MLTRSAAGARKLRVKVFSFAQPDPTAQSMTAVTVKSPARKTKQAGRGPVTLIPQLVMRRGREAGALKLIAAVRKEAQATQPGTLVYLVHRVLDGKGDRTLCFYERYRNQAALNIHMQSASWKAVVTQWQQYFEGASPKDIEILSVKRIAAFARKGAMPLAPLRRGAS
jgi:quinol monooxygenase YgiN